MTNLYFSKKSVDELLMLDQELLVCFVEEAREAVEAWQQVLLKLQKSATPENYNSLFRIAHNLKGTSKAVGLEDFGNALHKMEDVVSALKNATVQFDDNTQRFLSKSHDVILQWLDALSGKGTLPQLAEVMELREKILAGAANGQVLSAKEVTHSSDPKSSGNTVAVVVNTVVAVESMRIPVPKIDSLIQMLGELTTQHAILLHAKNHKLYNSEIFQESIDALGRMVREVHEQAISLRMQNLSATFARLEKTILDVSRDLSKSVRVELKGSDTELEKSILERIMDPLVHIVRNAVDHGIEDSQSRGQKSPTATITLSAKQEGREVVIEVQDDGRGINSKKIFDSACSKGLVSPQASLTENQIFQLLFLPGFSTAEKITHISGRGVGLDVVRQTLEELNGQIEIQSVFGKGTRFVIRLPLSLSIVDALIVSVSGTHLCVPIYQVSEILDLEECSVRNERGQAPLYQVRGQWIPAVSAQSIFDLEEQSELINQKKIMKRSIGLRVATRNMNSIITVDRIVDRATLLLRPSQDKWKSFGKMLGLSILGDGNPAPMVDLFKCLESLSELNQTQDKGIAA